MKISYDPEVDALYIWFQKGTSHRTVKVSEGVLLDLDETGKLFGIEIIGLKERVPLGELDQLILEIPRVGGEGSS